jgi:hypothetical protein
MENSSAVRQVRRHARPFAGRRRGTAKPAEKRTAGADGHGFLKYEFKPFWAYEGNRQKTEAEFFNSLSNLCIYYDLKIPDVAGHSFPQNIYRAWRVTAERIKAMDKQLDCIILKDEKHVATLATIRQFDTGMTLYYIPVKPLWNWSQEAQQQPIAEVVTAIFAYLHQVVQIPFYAEQGSYMSQQYDYMDELIHEDLDGEDNEEEKEHRQEQLDELYVLSNAGIHLFRSLNEKHWMDRMEAIVTGYARTAQAENEWAVLAIAFLQLYQQYPNRSFFDHIRPDLFHPEIEERIDAEQYVSFFWSGYDSLYDTMLEMIDCDLQEKAIADEPITVQLFDTLENKTNENFGFETRLFALLNKLCELLNQYDNGKYK